MGKNSNFQTRWSHDHNGELHANGQVEIETVVFPFTINMAKSGKYMFRGRMTIRSPKDDSTLKRISTKICNSNDTTPTQVNTKSPNKKEPGKYIEKEFDFNSLLDDEGRPDEALIKRKATVCAEKLFLENRNLIHSLLGTRPTENISPAEAYYNFSKGFFNGGKSKSEDYKKKLNGELQSVCLAFGARAMRTITVDDVRRVCRDMGAVVPHKIQILNRFWEYCLETKHVYSGNNPVQEYLNRENHRKRKPPKKLAEKAIAQKQLSKQQESMLHTHIEAGITDGRYMAIVLANGAGLSAELFCSLKWSDLVFSNQDFVIVKIELEMIAGATHNFSRPMFIEEARLLKMRYDSLLREYSKDALADYPVVSQANDPTKKVLSKDITTFIRKELRFVNASNIQLNKDLYGNAELGGAGTQLLLCNYGKRLIECGLETERGMLEFLRCHVIRDVTSSNYRSFTNSEGLRQILVFFRRYYIIIEYNTEGSQVFREETDGKTLIQTNVPGWGNVSNLRIKILLKADEEVDLSALFGIAGTIETRSVTADCKVKNLRMPETMII